MLLQESVYGSSLIHTFGICVYPLVFWKHGLQLRSFDPIPNQMHGLYIAWFIRLPGKIIFSRTRTISQEIDSNEFAARKTRFSVYVPADRLPTNVYKKPHLTHVCYANEERWSSVVKSLTYRVACLTFSDDVNSFHLPIKSVTGQITFTNTSQYKTHRSRHVQWICWNMRTFDAVKSSQTGEFLSTLGRLAHACLG